MQGHQNSLVENGAWVRIMESKGLLGMEGGVVQWKGEVDTFRMEIEGLELSGGCCVGMVLLLSCTGSVNLAGLEPSGVQDSVSTGLPAGVLLVKGQGAFGIEPQGSLGSPAPGSALRW